MPPTISDCIPAYHPPRPDASPPRVALQQPSTALIPAGGPACTQAAATSATAQSAADALVQAAQLEALRLQVSQLRRANATLQQQLAAAHAARAAAAKQAALHQLSSLQLGAAAGADTAAAPGSAPSEAQAAAAGVLAEELGVALPPGSDTVPLLYLQQLHACYTRRLAEERQRHADALAAQAEEAQARLQRQVRRAPYGGNVQPSRVYDSNAGQAWGWLAAAIWGFWGACLVGCIQHIVARRCSALPPTCLPFAALAGGAACPGGAAVDRGAAGPCQGGRGAAAARRLPLPEGGGCQGWLFI